MQFIKNNTKKPIAFLLATILCLLGFTACFRGTAPSATDTQVSSQGVARVITAKQAKEYMDTQSNYIILDVRTEEEFAQGHIAGALLIPDDELANRADTELPNKEQLILIYCRSGRRSNLAATTLADLGYTNVKDFSGIIDWPYEIVK